MKKINLGLLEFGFRKTLLSSMGNILDVIDYLVEADKLGYSSFWLGEHHNCISNSSWSNPQMLLPLFLNYTSNIKIGMAGVLINYYSPYEVALNFRMLANLFPERVDLGFANGNPPHRAGEMMLHQKYEFEARPRNYEQHIAQISEMFLEEEKVAQRDEFTLPPFKGLLPDMYWLSSSFRNYKKAVDYKLNIAKSNFHIKNSLDFNIDNIGRYRDAFQERHGAEPKVVMCFLGACHQNEAKAQAICKNFAENTVGFKFLHNPIMGTPQQFQDTIFDYQQRFGVNDFVMLDCGLRNEDKMESLHLMSEIFELNEAVPLAQAAAG